MQPTQRLYHAARDQEQHEREHDLGDKPEGTPTPNRAPNLPFESCDAAGLRSSPRRYQPADQCCREREDRRERDDAPVERQIQLDGEGRSHRGHDTFEDSGRPDCQHEAACAAADSQHEAFGQQLTYQARFRGAECLSYGQFAPAQGPAHEQEVADVHARDEQNDADDDHEQRCAQADEAPATRIWDSTYWFCHDRRQRFR